MDRRAFIQFSSASPLMANAGLLSRSLPDAKPEIEYKLARNDYDFGTMTGMSVSVAIGASVYRQAILLDQDDEDTLMKAIRLLDDWAQEKIKEVH